MTSKQVAVLKIPDDVPIEMQEDLKHLIEKANNGDITALLIIYNWAYKNNIKIEIRSL